MIYSDICKVILAVALFLAGDVSLAANRVLFGIVVKVQDGDSVKLLDDKNELHTIRLAGIDAPETRRFHGATSPQPFSRKSKSVLLQLVTGKAVSAVCHKKDRYRRNVCKLVVEDTDVNAELINKGLAWHYKRYASEQSIEDQLLYARLEENARNMRIGIWSEPDPMPPWDFRRKR